VLRRPRRLGIGGERSITAISMAGARRPSRFLDAAHRLG